ncbi:MAG: T9SS type A sorting domain-containing protein, partial [Candidatus Zixiibacteriota bacterium]
IIFRSGTEAVLRPFPFRLDGAVPNPFNAKTTINYQLPVDAHVKLEVYNVLGEKVATLVNEKQEPGRGSVVWDASEVSSGLYFYKLTAGDYTVTKRMMLVK